MSSPVWVTKGGWFKKLGETQAVCTFVPPDGGDPCGKECNIHNSSMWLHLTTKHDFSKEQAAQRLKEAQKSGMRRYTVDVQRAPLSKEQQAEYVSLSVALANQGLSLFSFDKRADKHLAVIDEHGKSAYDTHEPFTLHTWLLHVFPEFDKVTGVTLRSVSMTRLFSCSPTCALLLSR